MKLFLKNITFFIMFPSILLGIIEIIFPPTLFTFRTWEALSSKKIQFVGTFYPNATCEMVEEGDLAHHTNYSVKKTVNWRTDKLGFRNNFYIPNPDILLIGDSNITGSSLSQEETLASRLEQYTGLSVYSLAPADINKFIGLKNEDIMQTPQVVILSRIERNIPSLPSHNVNTRIQYAQIRLNPVVILGAIPLDKLIRMNLRQYLKSRINHASGSGIQSTIDKRMFFFQGSKAIIEMADDALDSIVERIDSYRNYCDSIGAKFIFLPIPNKETIFWELAGLEEEPTFMSELNQKLQDNGITTIDTIKLFSDLKNSGTLPYHYDDTHWNKYAVDAVAKTIVLFLAFGKDDDNERTALRGEVINY